jgi:hypothetical protein
MSDAPACPPAPPATARAELLTVTLAPNSSLHRIYRGIEPAKFSRTAGANRFDPLPDPWAATEVLYAGSTAEVALSETVLRWHDRFTPGISLILERSKIAGRLLIELRLNRVVELIDLTGFGLGRVAGLTAPAVPDHLFLANRAHYPATQAWGAWLRTQLPLAAGFRWMSRHHNSSFCYVFFHDRVGCDTFEVVRPGEALDDSRSSAHRMLLNCLRSLGWELD